MRKTTKYSSSSSVSSSSRPVISSSASSFSQRQRNLSTDLRLGLSFPASQQIDYTYLSGVQRQPSESGHPRSQSQLRGSAIAEGNEYISEHASLFVKVNMDGTLIGRKLNLLALGGYEDLIQILDNMFETNIIWGDGMDTLQSEKCHVLTYEDEEGDFLIVGDVPWEMFLSTVKRLKITRVDTCGC